MSLPENPFFTKELRQFRQRRTAVRWWLGCSLGGMLLMAALAALLLGYPDNGTTPVDEWDIFALVWMLSFPHVVLCLSAASYGAERLFAAEYKASTLQEVLTLPFSSTAWLVSKYVFPLALFAGAWVLGLPFYLFYVAIKAASWTTVLRLALVPLTMGLGWLALAPLFPPAYLQTWQDGAGKGPQDPRVREVKLDGFVRVGMAYAIVALVGSLWIRGFAPWLQWRPFYITMIPEGFLWLGVAVCFVWAWGQSLAAVVEGSAAGEHRAVAFRLSSVALAYYSVLGLNWLELEPGRRWLWFGAFPLVAMLLSRLGRRGSRERREDAFTLRELAWIGARWDNPVLLKDLRTYARASSVTRTAALSLVWVSIFAAGVFWASGYMRPGTFGSQQILMYGFFGLSGPSKLMAAQWTRERKSSTFVLTLISPLTSAEILWGRLRAGVIYGWLAQSPGAFLILAGAVLWWPHLALMLTPGFLALFPFGLTCIVVFGCTASVAKGHRPGALDVALYLLQTATFIASVVVLAVGFFAPSLLLFVASVALCAANSVLCLHWYRNKIRQLDEVRRGDLPDIETEKPIAVTA